MALAKTVVIPSELDAAQRAENELLAEIAQYGYSEASQFAIKLAVEEALNNAIKHGNKFDDRRKVGLTFDISADRAIVTVRDEGGGFDPGHLPDPTSDENLEKPTGRGVMLMRAYMDEVSFNEKGNQVRLIKKNV